VTVFVEDGSFHSLHTVLFTFGRSAGYDLRPLDQKPVVNDGVALILVRNSDGAMAFAGSAWTYKCNDFHGISPDNNSNL
jgi:hypothetical protein